MKALMSIAFAFAFVAATAYAAGVIATAPGTTREQTQ